MLGHSNIPDNLLIQLFQVSKYAGGLLFAAKSPISPYPRRCKAWKFQVLISSHKIDIPITYLIIEIK